MTWLFTNKKDKQSQNVKKEDKKEWNVFELKKRGSLFLKGQENELNKIVRKRIIGLNNGFKENIIRRDYHKKH